jgi:hypothetical protein
VLWLFPYLVFELRYASHGRPSVREPAWLGGKVVFAIASTVTRARRVSSASGRPAPGPDKPPIEVLDEESARPFLDAMD